MGADNGITSEMVERELTYAYAVTELLYKTNRRGGIAFRRNLLNYAVSIIQYLKLEQIVKKLINRLGLEKLVKGWIE